MQVWVGTFPRDYCCWCCCCGSVAFGSAWQLGALFRVLLKQCKSIEAIEAQEVSQKKRSSIPLPCYIPKIFFLFEHIVYMVDICSLHATVLSSAQLCPVWTLASKDIVLYSPASTMPGINRFGWDRAQWQPWDLSRHYPNIMVNINAQTCGRHIHAPKGMFKQHVWTLHYCGVLSHVSCFFKLHTCQKLLLFSACSADDTLGPDEPQTWPGAFGLFIARSSSAASSCKHRMHKDYEGFHLHLLDC